MMSRKNLFVMLASVVVCVAASAAFGQPEPPEYPPDWGWPNGDFNGYWGYPDHDPWHTPDSSSSWTYDGLLGEPMVVDGRECYGVVNNRNADAHAYIILEIDNLHLPNFIKNLWVEYDYYLADNCALIGPQAEGDNDFNWGTNDVTETLVDMSYGEGPGWRTGWSWWKLDPQPERERVIWDFNVGPGQTIGFGQVYWSTFCEVPGPATLSLFALGMLARRRRR